jgi:hypothetical protein
MEPLTVVLFILLGSCLVCAVARASVAKEKNRDAVEGVLFGALFGPIGILITALLPTKPLDWFPDALHTLRPSPFPQPRSCGIL